MVIRASQNETSSDIPSLNAIAAGTRASTNNVLTGILGALETAIDDGGEDDGSDAGDPARPDKSSGVESGRTRRHPAQDQQFPYRSQKREKRKRQVQNAGRERERPWCARGHQKLPVGGEEK